MKRSLSYRLILLLLLLVLAASLVPLFLLAPYDSPCADDFNYGVKVHLALRAGASFSGAVRAAAQMAADSYRNWQGTFTATFLMALQPAAFGESLYALTPFLMTAMLLAGTFCFCLSLFTHVFGLPRSFGGCVAALLSLLSLQLCPSPVQGLYWFNGSVYYTFFYGLSLLSFALAIPAAGRGGAGRIALLCLLCLALGGGNFVTALNCCILYAAAILLCLILKRPGWKRLLPALLCLLLSFALSATAPGNAVRQSVTPHTPDAVWAIKASFLEAAKSCAAFFSLPVAGGLVLLALLFRSGAGQSRSAFRLPALVTFFSFCVYAALFTPTLYAQGGTGAGRLSDIIFYMWLLLLALNLFYWIGWLTRRRSAPRPDGLPLLPTLLGGLLCLGCCVAFILAGHGFTSLMALGHLRSGEAAAYHEVYEARLAILQDDSVRDAELEPFPVTPYLLFFDDISRDASNWRNTAVSEYYGKDSVILK